MKYKISIADNQVKKTKILNMYINFKKKKKLQLVMIKFGSYKYI